MRFCRSSSATTAAGALDVEHHEVRLAVAVDLVGETLEAPGFGLGDLAAALLDDFGGIGGERVDLSLAQILARQEKPSGS